MGHTKRFRHEFNAIFYHIVTHLDCLPELVARTMIRLPIRSLRSAPHPIRSRTAGLHCSAAPRSPSSSLGRLAAAKAQDVESKWRGTSTSGGTTKNYVNGQFVDSQAHRWIDVPDPVSGA